MPHTSMDDGTQVLSSPASPLYAGASTVLGPLQPAGPTVRYRKVLDRREDVTAAVFGSLYITTVLAFIGYLVWPTHLPDLASHGLLWSTCAIAGTVAVVGLQVIALLQFTTLLHFLSRAVDPVPMQPQAGLRVAMLTTIIPSKEPWEIAEATLRAFTRQDYAGQVDAWVLDEDDDPDIRLRCAELGIHHFSRKGVAAWNTPSGEFRARTKHGNHNAWRAAHEHEYDVVTQMDPDHKPLSSNDFLQRILGYFVDPDVAFVVAPQVYGNHDAGFVARGAAELAYVFHGVVQRGANGLGAPLLIGTNHAYRPSAWRAIGGYQDCIIEDHLTAMKVPQVVNPETGARWKGVYTPDILSEGEGPTTWTDFFSQQARWAYGIFEIATTKTPHAMRHLDVRQRISFMSLQFFYPSVAASWVLGNFLSGLYLVGGVSSTRLDPAVWAVLFVTSMVLALSFTVWMRRFNLAPHERASWGLHGMLLNLVTTPVYLGAGLRQLLGRPLAYRVTAKGRLASDDSLHTFRLQFLWSGLAASCIAAGVLLDHDYPSLYVWMVITIALSLTPIAIWARTEAARRTTPVLRLPSWRPAAAASAAVLLLVVAFGSVDVLRQDAQPVSRAAADAPAALSSRVEPRVAPQEVADDLVRRFGLSVDVDERRRMLAELQHLATLPGVDVPPGVHQTTAQEQPVPGQGAPTTVSRHTDPTEGSS